MLQEIDFGGRVGVYFVVGMVYVVVVVGMVGIADLLAWCGVHLSLLSDAPWQHWHPCF